MRINLKLMNIKLIYYSCVFVIIFGMLKVTNAFSNSNGIYNIFRCICTVLCIFYCMFYFKAKSNKHLKFIGIMVLYELIIMVITFSFCFPDGIIDVLLWPLLIFVFYDYTITKNDYKFIKKSIVLVYIVIILISLYLISIHLSGKGKGGYVIFPSYFCISILPLVFKFQSEKKNKIFIVISIIILMLTTKRTGFLIACIGGGLYLVSSIVLTKTYWKKLKKYIKYALLILMIIMIILVFAKDEIQSILARFDRLSADGGSGRENIWKNILISFNNSSIIQRLFGHGTHSVMYKLMPGGVSRFAHNSFIEYLYDYGIVGLVFIVVYVISIIIKLNRYRVTKNDNYPILAYILTIMIFLGMFSYFFEQAYIIIPVSIVMGILIGEEKKELVKNEN